MDSRGNLNFWEGGPFFQKLDDWNIPFRWHKCRRMGHQKADCKEEFFGPSIMKEDEKPRNLMEDVINIIKFLIPLDQTFAYSFVRKFSNFFPMLLNVLSMEWVLGSLSVSGLDDIDKGLGEVSVKVMGVYLTGNEESLEKDFPSREYLYDENSL